MKVAPIDKQGDTPVVWKNYGYTEYFATLIPLPMFLKIFRGKFQQLFNRRAYVLSNCNMCIGEVAFFLISFGGMGVYFGLAYDEPFNSGWAASVPMLFCVIFAIKNSILCFLFGICYERGIFWHKAFAYMTLLGSILHFAPLRHLSSNTSKEYTSGWVIMASIFFLWLFSLPIVRHNYYEIFIRFHWIGFISALVGIFYHKIVLGYIAAGYWGFDFIIKQFVIYRHAQNCTDITVHQVSPRVLRIDLSRNDFPFISGQYVYICIPQLSYFQWHPFGIQSSAGQNRITLYLKIIGNWTRDLSAIVTKNQGTVVLKAFFSGPYGFPSIDLVSDHYKSFLLVGGGIGMAPIISVCKSLLEQRKTNSRPITKLMLVWTTRDKEPFDDFISDDYIQSLLSAEDKEKKLFESYYHFSGDHHHSKTDLETTNIKQTEDHPQSSQFIHSRPDLTKYIQELANYAKQAGEKRAAILVCGPDNLIVQVQHEASKQSSSELRIDIHEVVFLI